MLLAQKGYKVLLIDRMRFPSDVPHGIFLHRHGPQRLQRWGLLGQVEATGTSPIYTLLTDYGDYPMIGLDLQSNGVAYAYAPRRFALDPILVDAAIAAGAEFREGFAVDDYLMQGGRVEGIRGRDLGAHRVLTERARLTIGADGRNSRLARAVGAATYLATPPLTCYYFSYWSGVQASGLEMYHRPGRLIIAHPSGGGLTAVLAVWRHEEMNVFRNDLEGNYLRSLDLAPDLQERVYQGRREERIYGIGDLPNFVRQPFGPGWALVGDAGCSKDPYLALGICDAFRDAEYLADAVDGGFSGTGSLDNALREYECCRNAAIRVDYDTNIQYARLLPFPREVMRLRAAMRGQPELINQFYRAEEGLIPRDEFFDPHNLRRILGRSRVPA